MKRVVLPTLVVLLGVVTGARSAAPATATEERPYRLVVPASYEEGEAAPLVVLLHGYGSNGEQQDAYFKMSAVAEEEGFLLATPNGTRDSVGRNFWNATDACCDFFGSGIDDVAYLDAVIDEVSEGYTVDADRVYLVGHSNGAFMSHRYACDWPDRVAAIVTLAGTNWADEARCEPASAVSVLHVHGTEDSVVSYEGGSTPQGEYPGAEETVADWATDNGCKTTKVTPSGRLDLDTAVPGDETLTAEVPGCGDVGVALWTMEGAGHSPAFNGDWAPAVWEFLDAHPKP